MSKSIQEVIVPDGILFGKIYSLRHENIMLDRDLADLYGVKPFRLREQVRRNIEKFPEHFMFQLTEQEVDIMVSQNAIPSRQHLGGSLPYAFGEHGVLMLSNVLKSELATKMSIKLIEIFVQLRRSLHSYSELRLEIEQIKKKLDNQDKNLEVVFQYLDEMVDKKQQPVTERKPIGYELKDKL
ncbi:ORF6N domain-containing protein [Sphingobacterium nematocida]|uniref:ORF6N domain-containing protein n=1 Tax=Sphingobacterium nematocida TaxID=1513896 RepID=A0A1T5EW37_9SPHI|nr:ORF6N domain-containing protein [Sphingobacterium nematocida]SKB88182.1 ORF6N domain-containing protein [Sphingobacterium nematocida]